LTGARANTAPLVNKVVVKDLAGDSEFEEARKFVMQLLPEEKRQPSSHGEEAGPAANAELVPRK